MRLLPASLSIVASAVLALRPAAQEQREADAAIQQAIAQRKQLVEATLERLRSADPKVVAWGAHAVTTNGLGECAEAVRAALGRRGQWREREARIVQNALLDALVTTGASVPVEELEPFVTTLPGVVLLLRAPKPADLLVRALRANTVGHEAWCALGTRLANERSPELVAELLRLPIRIDVAVDGVTFRPDSSGCNLGLDRSWPPYVNYWLETAPTPNSRVVVDGPLRVAFRRVAGNRPKGGGSRDDRSEEHRERWLRHVLGDSCPAVVVPLHVDRSVDWKDGASFVAEVREIFDATERDWRTLVGASVAAGLLPTELAQRMQPAITRNVVDCRDDRSVPLPEVK